MLLEVLVLPELEDVLEEDEEEEEEDEDEEEPEEDDLPDEPPLSARADVALRASNRVALVATRAERMKVMARFLKLDKFSSCV